ncbi:MAG: tetratricopeptide repeat protein [Deltaproteobacteria bacterium]|nr:tetratricopeptide repeat protein [Deltaproteobacteria bacterium]
MAETRPNPRFARASVAVGLLLAAFVIYARGVSAPYLWDDVSLIEQNRTLDDTANIPRYFLEDLGHFNRDPREMGFYRPLQALAFHLDAALFGRNAAAERAINILWHALAGIAVFLLAATVIPSERWAAAAGFAFVLNPLSSEQVMLIANRGGLMTAVLALWTLVFLERSLRNGKAICRKSLAVAAVLYLAALLSKPEAITMPALTALWFIFAHPKRIREARVWIATIGLVTAVTAAYAFWRWGYLGITHGHRVEGFALPFRDRFLAAPRIMLEALRLILLPVNLRVVRSVNIAEYANAASFAVSAATWLVFFAAAFAARKRAPGLLFGLLFFALAVGPYSGLVTIMRAVVEHYYYIPTVGVCVALGAGFASWRRERVAVIVAAAVFASYAAGTVNRLGPWRSEHALWLDNVRKEPMNPHALNNLASVYAERGEPEQALPYLDASIAVNPGDVKARANRANLAVTLERWDTVLEDVRVVLDREPCHAKALVHLGRLMVRRPSADADAFAADYAAGHPCAAVLEIGRGMALEEQGRSDEARAAYERFLTAAPDHPLAGRIRERLDDRM